ncbi:MAG: phosphoribosylformimino-5-aminoimidazole carboxamide ribotide isomerase [Lachnospiraceae bacterium]|nr:phosphoribosylformimino-5-aminoimidazole carboxamide ribotide isomerase [Lachnospiraceae bacterium]
MRFRPCIDIHNGAVKQIVGGTLNDRSTSETKENFVSDKDAAFFAALYRERDLPGGHVILLNPKDSPYYEATKEQALGALRAYPGGLQAGGGITPENAADFLDAGASHVIVTSYVFREGRIEEKNLEKMAASVGKDRLVLDLSCRLKNDRYYIVTDRWQRFTDVELTAGLLSELSGACNEFLVHAADVEGKQAGIEEEAVRILASSPVPATYAGGIRNLSDVEKIRELGLGKVDFTVGSALDLFGGALPFETVARK